MTDWAGRTDAEREAARLERARRRAERAGQPASGPGLEAEVDDRDDGFETVDDRDDEFETADDHDDGFETADDHDHDFETDEHEPELPSGTRRITRLESLAARRERKQSERRRPKPARRQKHSWIGRAASVLALLVAGALIWFLIELFQPFHGSAHGQVTVVIPAHSSSGQIGDLLAKEGVISSSFFFELRATLAGERGDLRSGVYHLQEGMSYGAVLTALTKAPRAAKVTNVTIIEGRSRHEVDALLRSQHVHGSYLAATRSSPLLNFKKYGLRHRPPSLEGFLFPDTYQLVEPVKISALVTDQLRAFKRQFAKVDLSYARRRHLTPYDVLIIASLIEGEAATERDRLLVASVIYNRLAAGMPLQLDATTRFATGNYTRALTLAQLHSRSPYNTRTHVGLPPGPINSPGMAAIRAAAHPAHSRYLYFFTPPCGHRDVFASSYSRFLSLQNQPRFKKRC